MARVGIGEPGAARLARLWLAVLAVLVVAFVAANPPLRHAARNSLPLALALAVTMALAGLGAPASRRLLAGRPLAWQAIGAYALGCGLTGLLTLLLGVVRAFDARIYLGWYGAGLGLFAAAAWRSRARLRLPPIPRSPWNALALAAFVLFLVPLWPFAAAPVASTDALQYHLLVPRLYLAAGGIERIPLLVEAHYPNLAKFNYLPLLRLGSDVACQGLHLWAGVLLLAALGVLAFRVAPASTPLLPPALFVSMPVVAVHMGWAWNDLFFTLFVVLALGELVEHRLADPPRPARPALAAGVFLGLASWTKYTSVLVLAALVLLLAAGWRRWRLEARPLGWMAAAIGLVALTWSVQNLVLTGNPFYPFLHAVFASPYWTEAADRWFHAALRRFEIPEWNWKTWLLFPLHLSLTPRIAEAHTGVLPLALVPLAFARGRSPGQRLLAGYVVAAFAVWLLLHTENRSLLSAFAALVVAGGSVLGRPDGPLGRLRSLALAGFAAALLANWVVLLVVTDHLTRPVSRFLGLESREAFLEHGAESQPAYAYLNRSPEVGGVLLVGLHGPYYLEKPYLFSSFADPPIAEVLLAGAGGAEAMAERLRARGITHVVVRPQRFAEESRGGLYTWSEGDRAAFAELLAAHASVVFAGGGDVVYRLDGAGRPGP